MFTLAMRDHRNIVLSAVIGEIICCLRKTVSDTPPDFPGAAFLTHHFIDWLCVRPWPGTVSKAREPDQESWR